MSTRSKKPATRAPRAAAPVPATGITLSTKSVTAKATSRVKPAVPKPSVPVTPVVSKASPQPRPAAFVRPELAKPKVKKPKLVRDSFTIPKAEYSVLADLKQRAAKLTSPAKKSELLRAGVKALAAMSDVAFAAALKAVPTIKTGRPAKSKPA